MSQVVSGNQLKGCLLKLALKEFKRSSFFFLSPSHLSICPGTLSTRQLRYVVLDWTWEDAKKRQLWQVPEVRINHERHHTRKGVFPNV